MTKRYVVIEENDSDEGCGLMLAILLAAVYVLRWIGDVLSWIGDVLRQAFNWIGDVLSWIGDVLRQAFNWIDANLWIAVIIAVAVIIVGLWWYKKGQ